MTITLFRDMLRWNWTVEDDDGETLSFGYAGDYTQAAVAALMAFDAHQERGE